MANTSNNFTEQQIFNSIFEESSGALAMGGTSPTNPPASLKFTMQEVLNRVYDETNQCLDGI